MFETITSDDDAGRAYGDDVGRIYDDNSDDGLISMEIMMIIK